MSGTADDGDGMSDLPTRLREASGLIARWCMKQHRPDDRALISIPRRPENVDAICDEAADRIEALTAERDRLREALTRIKMRVLNHSSAEARDVYVEANAALAEATWNARAKPRGAGSVMPATIPWQGRRLTHIAHMDTGIKDGDVYLTVYDSDLRPIGVARFTGEGCRRQSAALAAAADRAVAALDL